MLLAAGFSGCARRKTDSVSLVARLSQSAHPIAFANAQHLAENIGEKPSVSALERELESLHHTPYTNGKMPGQTYDDVRAIYSDRKILRKMDFGQLHRIRALIDALKTPRFRKRVMDEIRLDLADAQVKEGYLPSEHGGLIVFRDHILDIVPIASIDSIIRKKDIEKFGNRVAALFSGSNSTYRMPENTRVILPHVFGYHMHAAQEDSTDYAGPSYERSEFYDNDIGRDIGYALMLMEKHGEAHEVVFTKLKGDRFNAGYFGGKKGGKVFVLSLGDYDE